MNNINNECLGYMGIIFGHKYKSFIVDEFNYSKVDKPMPTQFDGNLIAYREIIKETTSTENRKNNMYKILCKRCGKEPENNPNDKK